MILAILYDSKIKETFTTLLEEKDLHKIYLLGLEVIEMQALTNYIPLEDLEKLKIKENKDFDLEFGIN